MLLLGFARRLRSLEQQKHARWNTGPGQARWMRCDAGELLDPIRYAVGAARRVRARPIRPEMTNATPAPTRHHRTGVCMAASEAKRAPMIIRQMPSTCALRMAFASLRREVSGGGGSAASRTYDQHYADVGTVRQDDSQPAAAVPRATGAVLEPEQLPELAGRRRQCQDIRLTAPPVAARARPCCPRDPSPIRTFRTRSRRSFPEPCILRREAPAAARSGRRRDSSP